MRRGIKKISVDLLKEALNLPEDIYILGIEFDLYNYGILIHGISKEFPEIGEGCTTPVL